MFYVINVVENNWNPMFEYLDALMAFYPKE